MDWYYAVGSQRAGPVSDAQLDELVRSGKVSGDTLVWRDGLADWQPLHSVPRDGAMAAPGGRSGIICAGCGRPFPPEDVIKVNQSWICAQCKPLFLQRLREGAVPVGAGIWRSGRKLVTRSETTFPDRCIKCNAPANGFRLRRVLYWMHPLWLLLILINVLILLIVYLIIRKKAILHIGVCETHQVRRKRGLIVGWSSFLAGLALIIYGAFMSSGWTALAGVLLVFIGGISGAVLARLVTPTKINKENVWITGCHPEFLNQFPEWPGV